MQPSKQISTISDMQRQLEMIDLASLNLPNSIHNQSSDEDDEMMRSMRSKQYNLKRSINVPIEQPTYIKTSYLFDIDADVAYKRRQRSLKRIAKLGQDEQQQFSNNMYGTGKPIDSKTTLTTDSIKTAAMFSGFRSHLHRLNSRIPLQRSWDFGDLLAYSDNKKLETISREFRAFGCSMCSGFGHSKSSCPSLKHLQGIKNNQSFNSTRVNHTIAWVNSRVGVYCDRWLLGDFLGSSTWKQILLVRDQQNQVGNAILMQCESLGEDLMRIYKMQCAVCQGFGHVIKQQAVKKQRQNKNGTFTHVAGATERNICGKIYFEYQSYCPTKGKMEEILLGSKDAYYKFRQLLLKHKQEVKSKGTTRIYDGLEFADTKDVLNYIDTMIDKPKDSWKESGDLSKEEIKENADLKTEADAAQKALEDELKKSGVPLMGQPAQVPVQAPGQAAPAQAKVIDEVVQKRLDVHKFLISCFARAPALAAVATHASQIQKQNDDEDLKEQQEDMQILNEQLQKASEEDEEVAKKLKSDILKKQNDVIKRTFTLLQSVGGDPVSDKAHVGGEVIPYITCRHQINEDRVKLLMRYLVDVYEFTGFTFKVPADQTQTTNILNLFNQFTAIYFTAFFKNEDEAKKAYSFVVEFKALAPPRSQKFEKVGRITGQQVDPPAQCCTFAKATA